MSAVSYYFGRRIHQEANIPIGIINAAYGGSRIEPWIPEYNGNVASSTLYNAMINPIVPMTIKGFLWYQGESNSQSSIAAYQ